MCKAAFFTLPWMMSWVLAGPPLSESQLLRTAAAFDLVEGVVADPTSSSIFVMGANGGVEALSTMTGDLLWSYEDAAKPIGIFGDWVVAQTASASNVLELLRLDAAEGTRVEGESLKITLPNDVYAQVNDGLGRSFSARSHFISETFFLDWRYQIRVIQGMAPRDGIVPVNNLAGAYLIDFDQNQASATASGSLPLDPTEVLPETVTDWLAANKPAIPPLRVGNLFAATTLAGSFPQIRVVLKRWDADSGQELPDVVLTDKRQVLQFASADGRHALITTRVTAGLGPEYKWEFFSLETGEAAGNILDSFSLGQFFLEDHLVILVTPPYARLENGRMVEYPRRLRAIRLNTSQLLWDHPIRDTQYRGPMPP